MSGPYIQKKIQHHVLGYDRGRDMAIESAEKVQADAVAEQVHNANVLREKFIILKFFCYNCHGPHYWGGLQRNVGIINYSHFCSNAKDVRSYRNILLEKTYKDVPESDALALASPRD